LRFISLLANCHLPVSAYRSIVRRSNDFFAPPQPSLFLARSIPFHFCPSPSFLASLVIYLFSASILFLARCALFRPVAAILRLAIVGMVSR
jgi:hypothetical protein